MWSGRVRSASWRGALAGVLLVAATAHGAPETVVVTGLFKDRAVLEIDGRQRLLRTGETSPEGVKLIEANSRRAILEIDGVRAEYPLGDRIQTGFAPPAMETVQVPLSPSGMYLAVGAINGRVVTFHVDTGATAVALSSDLADTVGIDYLKEGRRERVVTASGVTTAYYVTLAEVSVGNIRKNNVRAAVLEGQLPRWPLLGMTFLGQVEIVKGDTLLELRSR
jgi:aspartyl protease family protein